MSTSLYQGTKRIFDHGNMSCAKMEILAMVCIFNMSLCSEQNEDFHAMIDAIDPNHFTLLTRHVIRVCWEPTCRVRVR